MPIPALAVGDPPAVRRREDSLATLLPDTRGADDEAGCDSPPIVNTSSTAADAEPVVSTSALDDSDEAMVSPEIASLFLSKPPFASFTGPPSPPGKRPSRPPSLPVAITPASALSPVLGRGCPSHKEPPAAVIRQESTREEEGGRRRGKAKANKTGGVEEELQQRKCPASTAPCLGESGVRSRSTSGQARPRSSMEEVGRWLESFDGRFKHSLKIFDECLS